MLKNQSEENKQKLIELGKKIGKIGVIKNSFFA